MSYQSFEPKRERPPWRERVRRLGRVGFVGGGIILGCIVLVVAAGVYFWAQFVPRSSVGIDSPQIAKPKLEGIEQQLSVELTGEEDGLANDSFVYSPTKGKKPDTTELLSCDGPDGSGQSYSISRVLDRPATDEDYATAVNFMKSLSGWSVAFADQKSVDELTATVFTHDEVGGIVVSYNREGTPSLTFWFDSHCFRD